jgi:hypothetical protein
MFWRKIRYGWQVRFRGLPGGSTPPISDNHNFKEPCLRTDHRTVESSRVHSTGFLEENPVFLEKNPVGNAVWRKIRYFLEKNMVKMEENSVSIPRVTVKYRWKHPSMALNASGIILMKIGNVFLVNDVFSYMAGAPKTTDMKLSSPSTRSHRSKQPSDHVHWQERENGFLGRRALPQTNVAQLEEVGKSMKILHCKLQSTCQAQTFRCGWKSVESVGNLNARKRKGLLRSRQ